MRQREFCLEYGVSKTISPAYGWSGSWQCQCRGAARPRHQHQAHAIYDLPILKGVFLRILAAGSVQIARYNNRSRARVDAGAAHLAGDRLQQKNAGESGICRVLGVIRKRSDYRSVQRVNHLQRAKRGSQRAKQRDIFAGGRDSIARRHLNHRIGRGKIDRKLQPLHHPLRHALAQNGEPARAIGLLALQRGRGQRASGEQREPMQPPCVDLLQ